jgi:hypothetical protein
MGRVERLLLYYLLTELELEKERRLRRPPRRYGGGGAGVDLAQFKPHPIDSATYHSGTITATQHGTQTSIPNAHHTPLIHEGVKVYLGTNQTIAKTTWTRLNLDTVVYDDWTDSFNTTTHLWTVPETTRYLIVAGLMWTNICGDADAEIRFRKTTGGNVLYGVLRPSITLGAGYASQRELTTGSLTKDDVYEFQCYHDCVTVTTVGSSEGYTFLSVTKIGEG